ncbi:HlyD family efflux transporter periplasmic adaptor subunit [Methylocystis sp. B8]|uniref:HlyD family secretion protein n=1 Tax=Methylocystis sp. B8 TaxID=544938 RepID=UPI0010FE1E91|nr:HlyD family efflux transporter periplasmic adaptor subunit [Methylocystis sp. B8]TLG78942.1 HlyD family efflux transporter periplasmic adaptor subunit [Methylocystis sp. B8]
MKPVAFFIALALLTVVVWGVTYRPANPNDVFLGYVEGDILYIGPYESERVASIAVAAGSEVKKGDPLFTMSTTLLDRARDEATARIAQLEAQAENLQAAMNRPEQIAVLQAALERAEAALQLSRSDYDRQRKLYADGHVAKAALDRAEMARARDEASVKEARRQVEASRMASRSQEIEAAEASLKQARAQLDALNIRIKRQSVVSPADGAVQDVFFRPGEIVNAGQPVIALLPPENRKVRFYVSEPELPKISLGERMRVTCDGCASDLYGRVSYIAGRQEYTPPVIFSDKERAKLVFKVEAHLEGAARAVPLGMPVAVTPAPESTGSTQ